MMAIAADVIAISFMAAPNMLVCSGIVDRWQGCLRELFFT